METLVMKSYWDLAEHIIKESHSPDNMKNGKQIVDFSFSVRKATKAVKDKADLMVRALNPKYFMRQDVIPVYRWAQNDSTIQITIKYSVKWDAPGAVNVKDPSVNITDGSFSFSANGEHSGMQYTYLLALDFFDQIDPTASSWSS